jgi:hypothetical protein
MKVILDYSIRKSKNQQKTGKQTSPRVTNLSPEMLKIAYVYVWLKETCVL